MSKTRKPLTEGQIERRNEVIATLKSLIFPLVLCAVLALGVFLIIKFVNVEEVSKTVVPYGYEGDGNEIVLETDDLTLRMDPLTTAFTVEQKSTGKVWYSVAKNAENDGYALGSEKGKLQSNLFLTYSIENGLLTTYDSFSYSVKNGIYDIQTEGDTIKIFYSLGNVEREYIIPTVITKKRLDEFKKSMPDDKASVITEYYKKYDIKKLKDTDDKEQLLADYPILETEVIYVLRSTTKESTKKSLEATFEAAGYTYDEYLADKELDMSTADVDKSVFNLEMDIRLDNNDLVVEVPLKSIDCPTGYYAYEINLLPYFGAGGMDEEGYMLVPEGGGAIINYNNGKVAQSSYFANVYGWDMDLSRKAVVHDTRASYGVFGHATAGSSFLCILEDGASYAAVQADVSGKNNGYNYVNALYSLASREQFDLGASSNTTIYAHLEELPDENLVQRYRFIDSDDYSDMAATYREYLQDRYGNYLALNSDVNVPVNIEVVGAVDKVKQILGVPVSRPLELTSYKEAQSMMEELYAAGFTNMSMKYTGWCNGGVNQKILQNVRLVPGLGSGKDLKALSAKASELGVNVALNGVTNYEHESNIFDGFFSYRDAARLVSKERAALYVYSHVTYAQRENDDNLYYLLHTGLAFKMAENLRNAARKYSLGVSFEDIGMDLSSDFYKKDYYSREAVKNLQEELLKSMDDAGEYIMINSGNEFAVPYADIVTDVDLKGSDYTIIDAKIPFYQMAIHGYVDYTGRSLNVCGNDEEELLNCAEYGAGLKFTLMDESSFTLQKTLYTSYYGSEYDAWKDRMIDIYTRYNNELSGLFNQEMVDHEIVDVDVTCTTYADGTKVYVNYNFSDNFTTPEGTVVSPRDYAVVR